MALAASGSKGRRVGSHGGQGCPIAAVRFDVSAHFGIGNLHVAQD
jgi:hypothetical protein